MSRCQIQRIKQATNDWSVVLVPSAAFLVSHLQTLVDVQMGNSDEANKNADAALELAAQVKGNDSTEDLCRTAWALKVHIADTGPKAKPVEPKDASPATLADLVVQRILSKQLAGTPEDLLRDRDCHRQFPLHCRCQEVPPHT